MNLLKAYVTSRKLKPVKICQMRSIKNYVQGGSNMTGTDFFVNKPQCDVQVSVW
jgi:hypothetical protein